MNIGKKRLLLFVSSFVLLLHGGYAWWDCSWKYRIPITIQETSGNNLANYPVNITIDTASLISAGKMQANCADIRFTYVDSSGKEVEIPYWIEAGCDTSSTSILVSVPQIPAYSTITVYMYYGNPSATSKSDLYSVCPSGIIAGYCAEFGDTFDSGTLDPNKWQVTVGTLGNEVDVGYYCNPESGKALTTRWGDSETITSNALDFSDGTPRIIRYYYEQGADSDTYHCENPETGEDLYIEYLDNTGTWQVIGYYAGSDTSTEGVGQVVIADLPTSVYHSGFELRIRRVGGSGSDWDYWIVDDIVIAKKPGLVSYTIGSEENNGQIQSISVLSPANATIVNSASVTVKVQVNTICPVDIDATLSTSYPNAANYPMTCSGGTCSVTLDMNSIGLNPDGKVQYTITANTYSDSKTTSLYEFSVPTDVSVTITSPAYGNTIVGALFTVTAKVDSLLDITNCTINLPAGAVVSSQSYDPATKTCTFNIDLTNYCDDGTGKIPNSIMYNVSATNTAKVTNLSKDNLNPIYDPPISVSYVEAPDNGATLPERYLQIVASVSGTQKCELRTSFGTFAMNYTDGKCYAELYHPDLPIGSASFYVTGVGRCGLENYTDTRYVTIPAPEYRVELVPPTPADGSTLNIKFFEVQGQIIDNTRNSWKCILEVNGLINYTMDDRCYRYLYNDQVPLGTSSYKVYIVGTKWALSNVSETRTINVPVAAQEVDVVTPGSDSETINTVVRDAIASGKPAVVFAPALYLVNLVVNVTGVSNFRLIGGGATFAPLNKGFPVFSVYGGNLTMERMKITGAIFGIKLNNVNNVVLKDVETSDSLFPLNIKGGSNIVIESSKIGGKIYGPYIVNANNVTIKDSSVEVKVYGIYSQNSNNTVVDNTSVNSNIFGVIFEGGSRGLVKNSNIYGKIFAVWFKTGGNNIYNTTVSTKLFGVYSMGGNIVNYTRVEYSNLFGIYSLSNLDVIENSWVDYAKVFGLVVNGGTVNNVTVVDSKFHYKVTGNGVLANVTFGKDMRMDISYKGDLILARFTKSASTEGWEYTGKGLNVIGAGSVNATFYDNNYLSYMIFKVLGKLVEPMNTGRSFNTTEPGTFALFGHN